jgi:streptogramin lyase
VVARIWLVAVMLLALCCAPAAAADPVPEYFTMPAGYSAGTGIATAPDGTVWLAAVRLFRPAEIGRLTPAQAAPGTSNGIATFPTPVLSPAGSPSVRSVAFDGVNNRAWFVQSDGVVGWADPALVSPGTGAGMRATWLNTTLQGGATFSPDFGDVAVTDRGLAWVTERTTSNLVPYPGARLASVDAQLAVSELSNIAFQSTDMVLNGQRYDPKPAGIAIDALGNPWFAESDPGNPGWRIATPRGTDYSEYRIEPCSPVVTCSGSFTGTGPTDVAIAHDGSIWFTNQLRNEVGRLDPVGGTFTNYSLPAIDAGLAGGQARAISVAVDGTLWVVEYGGNTLSGANAIVKIVPSQPTPTATVFHLGRGKYPIAVAPDTRGNVWFSVSTDVAPGEVGRLAGVVGAVDGGGGGGGGAGGGDTGGGSGGARPLTPASVGVARVGTPTTDGTKLSVNQICVGPPQDRCSLLYLIATNEYVTGFPGSRSARASAAAKHRRGRRPQPVIVGQKALTLNGGQRRTVTIRLNATGRRLLRRTGRLTVFFTVTQRTASGRPKRVKALRVTFKQPVPRARRR